MEVLNWISDQLTLVAEAFGESLTEERIDIYARSLADIPQRSLKDAFGRAIRELKWFPKIAELRELAGVIAVDEEKVEADAAWKYVNEYLRKWGVDLWPIYSGGQKITAPPLKPRLEYAVRRIGGLWRLNQMTDESYPFMYRDFCEAYKLAPLAELSAPRLAQQFGDQVTQNVRQLAEVKTMNRQLPDAREGKQKENSQPRPDAHRS